MAYEALFSPFKVRGLELKNRIVLPGMNTKMTRSKDYIDDNMIGYHVAKAKAGCALNIFEVASVCPEPHAYMYMGLYKDEHVKQLKRLTDAVHEVGGLMGIQLWHGGFSPQQFFDETNVLETPDTCTVERLQEIVKQFGRGARMAVEAGFDAVEFHAAHSYLPHEMLSPGTNHRTDEYGGSFENRCRFLWEIVEEIRANIPESMPFFMRVDCIDELMPAVMTEQEIVDFINGCADRGVDVADMSRGNAMSFATVYEVPPYNLECGFNIENIYNIKKQIKIPVMGVGRINTPALANKVIEEGKFDLVAIGRAQIADPQWVEKARNGEDHLIRKCIACDQGCYDAVIDPRFPTITCTRNPMACLEYKGLTKAETAKKVLIVGGGMGGMMAAEVLKKRGHEPIICEAADKLGGNFLLAGLAPMKHEMTEAAEWEAAEVARLGVEVRLNTTVTPELIEEIKPDEVIIAIGADYVAPAAIAGVDGEHVFSQMQVLKGEANPTGKVLVVGCGTIGSEVAELLAARGCQVTAFDQKKVGNGLTMLRSMFFRPECQQYGIKAAGFSKVTAVEGNTVSYSVTTVNRQTKERTVTEKQDDFDAVVICTGIKSRPSDALVAKCEELGIKAHVIGDAKEARTALWATREGFQVACEI